MAGNVFWFVLDWQPSHDDETQCFAPSILSTLITLALIQSTILLLNSAREGQTNKNDFLLLLYAIISFGSLVRRLVHCPSTYSSKTKQLIVYIYTERDESTQPLSKFCTYIIVFRSTKTWISSAWSELQCKQTFAHGSTCRCYRHSTNFPQVKCKQIIFSYIIICSNTLEIPTSTTWHRYAGSVHTFLLESFFLWYSTLTHLW